MSEPTAHHYRYTGHGGVFVGLRHGIEALIHRHHTPPVGATVELAHGEEISTAEPVDHPHLEPIETLTPLPAAPEPAPETPEAAQDGPTPPAVTTETSQPDQAASSSQEAAQ